MVERTTVAAPKEDLDALRAEARKRGISLARLLGELVSDRARALRETRRPRIGVVTGGGGVARESVEDESSPAATSYKR